MPIPNRRDDLQSFGYSFLGYGRCKSCDAEFEWWTTPNGARMPFTVRKSGEEEVLEPHWSSCPKGYLFKRRK